MPYIPIFCKPLRPHRSCGGRVESKIIIFFTFLLLVLIFTSLADYCVTYMQRVCIIDQREETSIYRAWRIRAGKCLRDMFHDIRENGTSIH